MFLFLTFITKLGTKSINKVIYMLSIFLLCLLFTVEFCVYQMFGFYFDLSLLGAFDQVVGFASDGINLIIKNIIGVFTLFLPFILSIIFKKYIVINNASLKYSSINACF